MLLGDTLYWLLSKQEGGQQQQQQQQQQVAANASPNKKGRKASKAAAAAAATAAGPSARLRYAYLTSDLLERFEFTEEFDLLVSLVGVECGRHADGSLSKLSPWLLLPPGQPTPLLNLPALCPCPALPPPPAHPQLRVCMMMVLNACGTALIRHFLLPGFPVHSSALFITGLFTVVWLLYKV
jgi:hypothetical protein